MASRRIQERRAQHKRYKQDVERDGKPFFPHAMFHDTVMSLVVVCVIIGLACVWYFSADGSEDPGLLGPYLADFLRAGPEFGATTLSRFYSIHMLLVPGLIAAMIGAHIYLVTRLGTTAPPWLKADVDERLREDDV